MNKVVKCVLTVVVIVVVVVKFLAVQIERRLVFQPTKLAEAFSYGDLEQFLQAHINPNVSIAEYAVLSGGTKLGVVCFQNPETKNHLLLCHGNAGNLSDRLFFYEKLGRHASITLFDYRGYGKSGGSPSEEGMYADADAVWRFLVFEKGVAPSDVTIYGISIGGAVAAHLAEKVCREAVARSACPHALIVQSSFCGLRQLVSDLVSGFLGRFVHHRFDTPAKIAALGGKTKVLVSHSPGDELVPVSHSERLARVCARVPGGGTVYRLSGGHNTTDYDDGYVARIAEHLAHRRKN